MRTLVGGSRCATSWCDLDLTFLLAVMSLTYNTWSGLYLGKIRGVGSWYLLGTLVRGCRCATSCDLDLTFDLAVVTLTCKILSRLYLRDCKV